MIETGNEREQREALGDVAPAGAQPDAAPAMPSSVARELAANAPESNVTGAGARSFGAALARERERQRLSINDVAARLRLHPKQIIALEQELLSQLPAPAFVRGFVRNYARELRLAPEPLLALVNASLPPEGGSSLTPGGSAAVRAASAEGLSRGLTIFGIVGGLIVLGVVGWIAKQPRAVSAPIKAEAAPIVVPVPPAAAVEPAPVQAAPQLPTVSAGGGNSLAPSASAATLAPKAAIAGATMAPPGSQPGVSANVVGNASPPPARADGAANAGAAGNANISVAPASAATRALSNTSTAPAASAGRAASAGSSVSTMRLVFGDRPSWLEVTQGDGRLLYSGINDAGSQRMLVGVPPLRLVIGNASTVTLDYRGRRVDLKSVTSIDDVAHITLDSGAP